VPISSRVTPKSSTLGAPMRCSTLAIAF